MSSFYQDCLNRKDNIIFVIDDDDFVRSLVVTALMTYGQVYEFKDGKKLLENYDTLRPNITFLDINLGPENGFDLLKKITDLDEDAYVYMLSGNSTKDNIFKCKKLGAKGFVGKPFARKHFQAAIDKCPTMTKVLADI